MPREKFPANLHERERSFLPGNISLFWETIALSTLDARCVRPRKFTRFVFPRFHSDRASSLSSLCDFNANSSYDFVVLPSRTIQAEGWTEPPSADKMARIYICTVTV